MVIQAEVFGLKAPHELICPTESPRHQSLEAAGEVKIKCKTEKRLEAKHSPSPDAIVWIGNVPQRFSIE